MVLAFHNTRSPYCYHCSSSDDEEVIKRRLEAKLVADLVNGERAGKRHKKRSKHKHKKCVILYMHQAS